MICDPKLGSMTSLPRYPLLITGGVAEGKTTVLAFLAEAGARVESADHLVRQLWDDEGFRGRVQRSLNLSQPANRELVRNLIAEQPQLRQKLNALVHPLVREQLAERHYDAVEVPLAIETARTFEFQEVWVVTCGAEEQRRRLAARLGNEAEADRFLRTQLPTEVKTAFAHRVIRTDQPIPCVQTDVVKAWQSFRELQTLSGAE